VRILLIQPFGIFPQIQATLKTDFRNVQQNFGKYVGALSTENQAQTAPTNNGVQQALDRFQTDLAPLQSAYPGNQNPDSIQADFKNILAAVHSSIKAIKSGNQDEITNSQNALQQALSQFQSTLTNLQQTNTGTLDLNTAQADFQNLVGTINSLLAAHKAGYPDQITAAKEAMQKAVTQIQTDLPGLKKSQGHHPLHQKVNAADNNTGNNSFLSLLAAAKGYGRSGLNLPPGRTGGLNLSV
jgi:ElaB/YqjD/DUF883 family membrane-anchored ribosome-binding protein